MASRASSQVATICQTMESIWCNTNDLSFPYIETAPSIGSENDENEFEEYIPTKRLTIKRDLKRPYCQKNEYEYERIRSLLINTFQLNIHAMLEDTSTLVWCPFCLRPITLIKTGSVVSKLIYHIKRCLHLDGFGVIYNIQNEEALKTKKKLFSLAQLAREYIIVPYHKLKKRFKYNKYVLCKNNFAYDSYTCLLCCEGNFLEQTNYETDLKNGAYETIANHIKSDVHQNFKRQLESDPRVQEIIHKIHETFAEKWRRYRCELCNYENPLEMNFMSHLNDISHAIQFETISKDERKEYNYYFCYACLRLWYGHRETYRQHGNETEHKDLMPYYPYIEHIPKDCLLFLQHIKQNSQTIVTISDFALKDTNTINVLHQLKKDLRSTFPKIKAHLFGSRVSKLAFPGSDMDVFLDCERTYEGKISYSRSQEILKLIENQLSLNKSWEIKKIVLECRTPVINVLYIPLNISCDIVVTNGLGVEKTKLIRCFVEAFPMCRKLILFVKRWLQTSNQIGSYFITSYAASWCVIFYLQQLEIFPSVLHLIKLKNKSRKISGWETGVTYDFRIKQTEQTKRTFEELLFGFFTYYAEFNFVYNIICPLLGRCLQKSAFWSPNVYMNELKLYFDHIEQPIDWHTQKKPEKFLMSALSLQDPFDLSHNVTKMMNTTKVEQFRKICKFSARFLKKTLTGITSQTIEKYNVEWHVRNNDLD